MRGSRLTFNGFMQYDPDFLKGISIPAGLDRKVLANEILMKSFDLELVYPSYDFMRVMLERFTAARLWGWQKLYDTTLLKYNPIWNKDGTITETETRDLSKAEEGTRNDNRETSSEELINGSSRESDVAKRIDISSNSTVSSRNSESETTGESSSSSSGTESGTSTTATNAFNTGTWTDRDRTTTSGTKSESVSGETSGSETFEESGTVTENGRNTLDDTATKEGSTNNRSTQSGKDALKSSDQRSGTEEEKIVRTRDEHGNIGVTSTQQMIREEREIALFSIYEQIADDIVKAFCILVY